MPRNTVQHLSNIAGERLSNTAEATAYTSGAPALLPEEALPPELQRLVAERRVLEAKMDSLIGHPADAADRATNRRFPVTPLGERRRLDAAWAQRRDRAASIGTPVARSGQRTTSDPPSRSGLREFVGFDVKEFERRRAEIGDKRSAISAPMLDRFSTNGQPGKLEIRESGRALRPPIERPLPSVDDQMKKANRRLDILSGGSGDLNRLRAIAIARLQARRREQRSDDLRDAKRLDRNRSKRDERDGPFGRRDRQRGW